jgi:hypothetical protein
MRLRVVKGTPVLDCDLVILPAVSLPWLLSPMLTGLRLFGCHCIVTLTIFPASQRFGSAVAALANSACYDERISNYYTNRFEIRIVNSTLDKKTARTFP